eukprot:g1413.t1
MSEDHLMKVLHWAGDLGWNPGHRDAAPFRTADRDGFFSIADDDGGVMAGISAVRYGETYGFIGLYICAEEFRGNGHGTALFRHALRHLEGRVVGLDAVEAQQTNYAKHGFVLAHQTIRFVGELAVDVSSPTAAAGGDDDDGDGIQALTPENIDLVIAYDEKQFPAAREQFTRAWLTTPGHVARVAIEDGVVKGYGVLRPCVDGAKLAPLFASSVEVADLLTTALVAAAEAPAPTGCARAKVLLDVPEPNVEGLRMAERMGLRRVSVTGRMYLGPAPKLQLDQTFGFTSLELG